MNKSILSLFFILSSVFLSAQNKSSFKGPELKEFDKAAAWKEAQLKYTKPADQKEHFEFLMRKYMAARKSNAVIKANVPFSSNYNSANKTTTINLSPANANCPDMGFETGNFSGWQGDTWTLSGIDWTVPPVWSPGIVTMGNNNPAQPVSPGFTTPTQNRHTVLSVPPTVNNPPYNCVGWDSIAIDPSNHLSGIPFVPPYSNGVTCRLGNANTGEETERLRYNLAVSSSNSQITLSYAVVLQNPGHLANNQPFFQINLYDQSGNAISGCGNYQIDATLAKTDPTFVKAALWNDFNNPTPNVWTDPGSTYYYDSLYYKPWTQVGVDLTAYIGTTITIEFRTGDCAQGGHFGYAYVDASCSPSQIQVNMCPGFPNQEAVAPLGYSSYQWYGPNSTTNAIPAPNGTNDTLTITNGVNGDVYYLTAISANGCTTHLQATLKISSIGVSYTNSTPSCPGGNSGTAFVNPTGSPGSYTFSWTNSGGANVGTSNPVTGLSPGTYSVHVASVGCNSTFDTTVVVGIAPPVLQNSSKSFCGTATYLYVPGGPATNIQWYDPSGNAIAAPAGTNDTLLATNVFNNQVYSVVFTQGGCIDSLRIALSQVSGGTLTHSGTQNVCIGASNGQATINLSTTSSAPYNYSVTGPGSFSQNYPNSSQTSIPLTGLAYGSYSVTAYDGMCFYSDVFKIDTISIPVTVTVAPKALCSNDSAYINYTFAGSSVTQCQLATSGCSSTSTFLLGPANVSNTSTTYPTPFGNWYTKMKAQYIYTVAELNAAGVTAGKISSVAFNVTAINGAVSYPDFNISIGCTAQSTYSMSPVQTDIITGLTSVYSNASYNVTLGQNKFTFTQAYEWDGVSNLVVEVCFEFPGTSNYTQNCVVDNTNTTNYTSLTVVTDTDPICAGYTATGFYYAQSAQMRPVATFEWCNSQVTPSMFTYALNPPTGILNPPINPPTATILQPATTTAYTLTITSNLGGCAKKDTFTISIVKPFNIQMPAPASLCTSSPSSTVQATFTDASTGAPTTIPAVWSGSGISGNNGTGSATFNPSTAGAGTHTLMLTAGGMCMMKDSVVYTVNLFQSAALTQIGPFCVYDPPKMVPHVSNGGTWSGPVNSSGLFQPSVAGVTSNLTPPYHIIKYVTNAGSPCPDSATIHVEVFNKPMVSFTSDTTEGCEPSVGIQFTSNVSPSGGTYQWYFGNGQTSTSSSPSNIYTLPGLYSPKLTYTDVNGCRDSVTKPGLIIVHAKPVASFYATPDHGNILEPHIDFINTSQGTNNTWLWNIASFTTAITKNTSYDFVDPGLYQITLYATNTFGCKDSTTQFIKIDPDNVFYVPSGFTPNYDGKNDVFMAEAYGVFNNDGFKMMIYDRWGSKLFESNDIYKGWDGTRHGEVVQEDVYIYTFNYKDSTGKLHTKTGQVSLIK